MAVEPSGTLLVADGGGGGGRIVRVDPSDGTRTIVAGTGGRTFGGPGRAALQTSLGRVYSVAVGPDGAILSLIDNRVIRIGGDGLVRVVAGSGATASSGDGGPATAAGLAAPTDLAVDGGGNIYIAELGTNRIRRVDAQSGRISTVAHAGLEAPLVLNWAQDGSLLISELAVPGVLALRSDGTLTWAITGTRFAHAVLALADGSFLVGDHPPEHGGIGRILRVRAGESPSPVVDGGFTEPTSIARAPDGSVYVTTFDPRVPLGRLDPEAGILRPI